MLINFDFLLFGATGDLALRKIFPALYFAYLNGFLHNDFKIIASARSKLSANDFKTRLNEKSKIYIKDLSKWNEFLEKITYIDANINDVNDFLRLKAALRQGLDCIIYFSISPEFFIKCCKHLSSLKMNEKNTRIVLEKPLGMSLNECVSINESVAKYYKEEQIYRIDHYLGKNMVRELFNFRKNNPELNAMLNKNFVSSIELSVLERLGVEGRGEFYDTCGALKDMVQNHILQMLALFMIDINSSDLRQAKLDFFASLNSDVELIKAQYIKNETSLGYKEETNVAGNSLTETFVAIKTNSKLINYAGVPIFLRTGKRMLRDCVYFIINFKSGGYLRIEIQPKPSITWSLKIANEIKEFELGICEIENMPAYARLLISVVNKDLSSFNEKDELESAWKWAQKIIDMPFCMQEYLAFTDGINFSDCEFKK